METIVLIFLTLALIYLIFQHRCMNRELDDLSLQVEALQATCVDYLKRIKELENGRNKVISKRRKNTNRYRKLYKSAISKCIVYCNNGWSVSKASLTKAKSKADRLLEGGKRFAYIRAERGLLWIIYRIKTRQEVLSYCRAKAVHIQQFGQGVLLRLRQRVRSMQRSNRQIF